MALPSFKDAAAYNIKLRCGHAAQRCLYRLSAMSMRHYPSSVLSHDFVMEQSMCFIDVELS